MPANASSIRDDRIDMTLMEFVFHIAFPPLEVMKYYSCILVCCLNNQCELTVYFYRIGSIVRTSVLSLVEAPDAPRLDGTLCVVVEVLNIMVSLTVRERRFSLSLT
jgi:hypothetical protein